MPCRKRLRKLFFPILKLYYFPLQELGKTLAFLLPIIAELDINCPEVQVLIVVPVPRIGHSNRAGDPWNGIGVTKLMRFNGGKRPVRKTKTEIKHRPAILIGTPGRIADHFAKGKFFSGFYYHIGTRWIRQIAGNRVWSWNERNTGIIAEGSEEDIDFSHSGSGDSEVCWFVGSNCHWLFAWGKFTAQSKNNTFCFQLISWKH